MKERVMNVLERIDDRIVSYTGSNLFEAGIVDSLRVIDIVESLEEEFGFEIDAEDVVEQNFRSVELIIDFVNRKTNTC